MVIKGATQVQVRFSVLHGAKMVERVVSTRILSHQWNTLVKSGRALTVCAIDGNVLTGDWSVVAGKIRSGKSATVRQEAKARRVSAKQSAAA